MKKKYLVLFLLALSFICQSQIIKIDSILNSKITYVKKNNPQPISGSIYYMFSINYGDSIILDKLFFEKLSNIKVDKIEFVYTSFHQNKQFNQKELNKKRFKELKNRFQSIFFDNKISWEVIEQTGANSYREAKNYFHGFIIYGTPQYIPSICGTTTERIQPICNKGNLLNSLNQSSYLQIINSDTVYKPGSYLVKGFKYDRYYNKSHYLILKSSLLPEYNYYTDTVYKVLYDTLSEKTIHRKNQENKIRFYKPKSKNKMAAGIIYTRKSIWNREQIFRFADTTVIGYDTCYLNLDIIENTPNKNLEIKDSVVHNTNYDVLKNIKDSQNIFILKDKTCLFSPYVLGKTILWTKEKLSSSILKQILADTSITPSVSKIIRQTNEYYYINYPFNKAIAELKSEKMKDEIYIASSTPLPSEDCDHCETIMIFDYPSSFDITDSTEIKPITIILCPQQTNEIKSQKDFSKIIPLESFIRNVNNRYLFLDSRQLESKITGGKFVFYDK